MCAPPHLLVLLRGGRGRGGSMEDLMDAKHFGEEGRRGVLLREGKRCAVLVLVSLCCLLPRGAQQGVTLCPPSRS